VAAALSHRFFTVVVVIDHPVVLGAAGRARIMAFGPDRAVDMDSSVILRLAVAGPQTTSHKPAIWGIAKHSA